MDVLNFPLIDPPDKTMLLTAAKELFLLEALDDCGRLTEIGNQMTHFPLPPSLSRALLEACGNQCSREMAGICAMLTSEDVFTRPRDERKSALAASRHARFHHPSGDHLTLLQILRAYQRASKDPSCDTREWCHKNFLNPRALRNAVDVERQLMDLVVKLGFSTGPAVPGDNDGDPRSILKSFAVAFYPQLAKRQYPRAVFYHYASTKSKSILSLDDTHATNTQIEDHLEDARTSAYMLGLYLHPNSSLLGGRNYTTNGSAGLMNCVQEDVDWVIYHDIQYTARAFMRFASKILLEWIPQRLISRLESSVSGEQLVGSQSAIAREKNYDNAFQEESPNAAADKNDEELLRRQKRELDAKQRFLERKLQKKSKTKS
jgi:HrpA-like RNA helicase